MYNTVHTRQKQTVQNDIMHNNLRLVYRVPSHCSGHPSQGVPFKLTPNDDPLTLTALLSPSSQHFPPMPTKIITGRTPTISTLSTAKLNERSISSIRVSALPEGVIDVMFSWGDALGAESLDDVRVVVT